ncbi:oxidoreductase [Sanguibacter suarezii]|uniref:oxidoreductase n=1 Tax=Sanguibacter suarezii TaxID=60921 RepID=UPI001FDEDAF3|nr:oxidoreductase [Sanguibacter suarezii]
MTSHAGMVALVTGASSGIGAETALALRDAGYTVYAVARRTERMADLTSRGIRTFAMDLTDDATITAGVERVLSEAGRIDLLVNNAGYGSFGAVEDVPLAEARRQFEVNVFGLARLVQLVTPGMRERHQGRIINISSIGGKIYEPLGAWYHATKFAVEGLSDCLRVELAEFGVRVVIVEPGPILTEWNALARESMLASSAGTAYEGQARSVARTLTAADDPRTGTRPGVVAQVIRRAATARRPRARYAAGKGAATILAARKILPDRAFDLVVARTFLR